jgi:hypothetical protein
MNGEVCCILGVCCPPGSAAQEEALSKELVKDGVCEAEYAPKVASWILKHFDLAEAGTLRPFVASILKHAKTKRG